MLSDEVLEKVTERVVQRIQDLNTNILKQIGSKIDEIGTLKPTQAQQLGQLIKYGGDYNKIVKELSKVSKLSQKDIKEIFKEVAKNDYRFAKQFYDYRGIGYIPYDENIALQSEVNAIANITARRCAEMMTPRALGFGLINKKTGDIEFKGLKQAYYDLLDEAILSVAQGKESFDQVMTRQIKQMGSGGLKVIYDSTYINKEGKEVHNSRRLDSAIRMNLKDSLRELHNETQDIFGKEFGADGVEISVHENPAPDHELVQGKQFSKIEFDKFQSDERAISYDGVVFEPEFEGHDRRSISEYNCYHYTFSIVLGVSEPEYSNEQLQEIIDRNNEGFEIDGKHYTRYQGTQMQRQLEAKIREQKDIQIMARASGKDELVQEAQQKITQLTTKYRELSNKADLPTKKQRMKVSGYTLKGRKRTKVKTIEEWNEYFGKKYGSYDIIEGHTEYSKGKDNWLELNDNLKNIDTDLLNDNLKQIDNLYSKYKLQDKGLSIKKEENGEFVAVARGDTEISLSYKGVKTKDEYIKKVNENIDTGFYMKVKKGNESNYAITHEMGHIIENRIIHKQDIVERSVVDNQIKETLLSNVSKRTGLSNEQIKEKYFSRYARSRKSFEWFAESFAQLELGDKNEWIEEFEKWLKTQY